MLTTHFSFFSLLSKKLEDLSSSERPKTRRLHQSSYDKEDLPIGEIRGLVALMPVIIGS
ncbi:hypothetical protein [Gracilibacillus orientalis]|nr:hypothetical protein [Gracilibacillus orientalis]